MKKYISKILTSLLFLQALFFQVDLPELVLCFGDDGHVAIEKKVETECDIDDFHDVSNQIFQILDPREDDCNDLTLDLHFSNADIQKNKNNIPLSNSKLYIPTFLNINHSLNTNHIILSSNNKQLTNTLLTTVLLI